MHPVVVVVVVVVVVLVVVVVVALKDVERTWENSGKKKEKKMFLNYRL